MLVLCRRKKERVMLPTINVTVEILEVRDNKVRIGISAPKELRIHKGENIARNKPTDTTEKGNG